MGRGLLQLAGLRSVFPGDEVPGHFLIADELATRLVILLLQRQRLVENETTGTGEAARTVLPAAVFHRFELVCLASFHDINLIVISLKKYGRLRRPRLISSPEETRI